ncbi:MAG: 50S ribosomal protein L28 [Clostridiales Family XIII bacterium]|jgi:large subunit ribosomal protein L28|nr:50S ribosomal protein L28 [Clostridiales Family XIII bacterium]
MSKKCVVCGKGQTSGNNVSHSNRHTRRKWNANIQSIKVNESGTVRHINVCTKCLRAGKVTKAV